MLDDAKLAELLGLAHDVGLTALVETHTEEEVRRAAGVGAKLMGVNCRDLRTFRTDPNLTAELVAKIPDGIVKIGESGLKTREDLLKVRAAGADGLEDGQTQRYGWEKTTRHIRRERSCASSAGNDRF